MTDVHCGLFRPATRIMVDAHSPPSTPEIFAAPLASKPGQVRGLGVALNYRVCRSARAMERGDDLTT